MHATAHQPADQIHWQQSILVRESRVRRLGTLLLTDTALVFVQQDRQVRQSGSIVQGGGPSGAVIALWLPLVWLYQWTVGRLQQGALMSTLDELGPISIDMLDTWVASTPGSFSIPWSKLEDVVQRSATKLDVQTTLGDHYTLILGDERKTVQRLIAELSTHGPASPS